MEEFFPLIFELKQLYHWPKPIRTNFLTPALCGTLKEDVEHTSSQICHLAVLNQRARTLADLRTIWVLTSVVVVVEEVVDMFSVDLALRRIIHQFIEAATLTVTRFKSLQLEH